jgi:hypothetical protein
VPRNDGDHREFCAVEESDALIYVASTTSGSIIKIEKYKSCDYLYQIIYDKYNINWNTIMSDNRTSMRQTLQLLESVEHGKKTQQLNESDHLDPNLSKAYNMGYKAYQAYKNDPELAQAAQDKIESEFPQYAKMWLTGYRDGERFDKQEARSSMNTMFGGDAKSLTDKLGIRKSGVAEGENDNYHHDAAKLAEGALDAAARYIQDELGVEFGDNAGMFFQGENLSMILDILTQYAEDEMQNQRDSDTENVDPSLEEGSDDKQSKLAELEEKLKQVQAMKGSIAAIGVQDLKRKIAKLKSELGVKENFGGGMRDRPGPDHKSFDLAECKEFLAKRTLKG